MCVYVYASLCDFVCIALLLPIVLGFCLSGFFVCFFDFLFGIDFSTCYHWWICFFIWLCSSFFPSLFLITLKIFFKNYFLFFILLTFKFYFILSFSFFLSFFLPFLLSRVDDRLLVLQPGIRAVPLRWESQVQETGPQETSQLHVISNGENLPEIAISMSRPSSTQ